MPERLTVVFDDENLYRRLKVKAAEQGVPMKTLIQEAVAAYLGPDVERSGRPFTWEIWERWQAESAALEEAEPGPEDLDDLSDVKRHLYGRDDALRRPGYRAVAEEPTPYDAGS